MKIHLCVSLLICVSSIHAIAIDETTPYPTTCCPTGDHYTCHCNHDSDCCESGAFCWDSHCLPQPTTLPPPTTTTPGCVESGEYCGYDDNVDCCEWYDSCLNGYCQQHPTTPPAPSTTASTEACAAEGQDCNHDSECCDWWCHENKCQCCGTSPWYTTTTPPPPSTTAPPPAGCSYLLLTTGADYPDSALTCYDSQGEEVARSADTQVVGTVIISVIYARTDFSWKVDIHLKIPYASQCEHKTPGKGKP